MLDEGLLEMPVEAAEETAVPKTAASWKKPENTPTAQKQKNAIWSRFLLFG